MRFDRKCLFQLFSSWNLFSPFKMDWNTSLGIKSADSNIKTSIQVSYPSQNRFSSRMLMNQSVHLGRQGYFYLIGQFYSTWEFWLGYGACMLVLMLLLADFMSNDVFQSILKGEIRFHDEKSWNDHFPSSRVYEPRRSKTENFTESHFRWQMSLWNFLFWTTFISSILL